MSATRLESNVLQLNEFGDDRGYLAVVEANKQVPFEIKRVFYIYGTAPHVRRGYHAHFNTRQALICVSGSCKVLLDDSKRKLDVTLDSPTKLLVLEPNEWHEMYDFSPDCVLLVLSSSEYDEKDYIRDYEKFLEVYASK